MTSDLLAPVYAGTPAAAITSDDAWLRAMLRAESALAAAQGHHDAARAITHADIDPRALAAESRQAANPAGPLAAQLRATIEHAHEGATSQDIMDTAAMIIARHAVIRVREDLGELTDQLAALAQAHRATPMAARTLGRHAVPTTFGLVAATWLNSLLDLPLAGLRFPAQLGGAAGTQAAFDGDPADLLAEYAARLDLDVPRAPWHTDRAPVRAIGAALSATAAALGTIATDVILLAQTEIAEVAESSTGGSSAMPHKRNPALATLIRSAAYQIPAYAQVLYATHEHQRAAGAWQAEWLPFRECLRLTGGAAHTTRELVAGLRVDTARMSANLALTGDLTGGPGAANAIIDRVLSAHRERQ